MVRNFDSAKQPFLAASRSCSKGPGLGVVKHEGRFGVVSAVESWVWRVLTGFVDVS